MNSRAVFEMDSLLVPGADSDCLGHFATTIWEKNPTISALKLNKVFNYVYLTVRPQT